MDEDDEKPEIQPVVIEEKSGNEFEFLSLFDGGSNQKNQSIQDKEIIFPSSSQKNQINGWEESLNQAQNNDADMQFNFSGFTTKSQNQIQPEIFFQPQIPQPQIPQPQITQIPQPQIAQPQMQIAQPQLAQPQIVPQQKIPQLSKKIPIAQFNTSATQNNQHNRTKSPMTFEPFESISNISTPFNQPSDNKFNPAQNKSLAPSFNTNNNFNFVNFNTPIIPKANQNQVIQQSKSNDPFANMTFKKSQSTNNQFSANFEEPTSGINPPLNQNQFNLFYPGDSKNKAPQPDLTSNNFNIDFGSNQFDPAFKTMKSNPIKVEDNGWDIDVNFNLPATTNTNKNQQFPIVPKVNVQNEDKEMDDFFNSIKVIKKGELTQDFRTFK